MLGNIVTGGVEAGQTDSILQPTGVNAAGYNVYYGSGKTETVPSLVLVT